MANVAVIGTFDTKGVENLFLIDRLKSFKLNVISVNMGFSYSSHFVPTYDSDIVLAAAGESFDSVKSYDKSERLELMRKGAANIISDLCKNNTVNGAIAIGGGQGTWMASAVMKAIPIGVPKIIVSTIATIDRCQNRLAGINDTFVINSLVDVSGLNPLLMQVLDNAALSLVGMILNRKNYLQTENSNLIRVGMTMWGVTTPCVSHIENILSNLENYEPYVFHATGMGGPIMDSLIKQLFFNVIADITLPEVTVNMAGGTYPSCPERLITAARNNIPMVIVPGGVDMIETTIPIPEKFKGRAVYMHNKDLAFVRSTEKDNAKFGYEIAKRINLSTAPVTVFFPLKGLSLNDISGNSFYDKAADLALLESLEKHLSDNINLIKVDAHINEPEFAELIAARIQDYAIGKQIP